MKDVSGDNKIEFLVEKHRNINIIQSTIQRKLDPINAHLDQISKSASKGNELPPNMMNREAAQQQSSNNKKS